MRMLSFLLWNFKPSSQKKLSSLKISSKIQKSQIARMHEIFHIKFTEKTKYYDEGIKCDNLHVMSCVFSRKKKIIFTCLIISHFFSSLLFFMASSCFTSLSGGFLGYHLCMRPPKVHRQQLENVAQKFYEAIVKIGFRSFGLQEKNTFNFSRRRRKAYALFDTTSQVSSWKKSRN